LRNLLDFTLPDAAMRACIRHANRYNQSCSLGAKGVRAPVDGCTGDLSRLDAAWLARLAHDALERRNAAVLAAIKAEIARRPLPERLACSREWIRQAPTRERARHQAARSPPGHWAFLAAELRRLVSTGPDERAEARSGQWAEHAWIGGPSEPPRKPACFDPLRLAETIGYGLLDSDPTGCGQRWEPWLSDHAGLTNLGVNLTRIASGTQTPPRQHRPVRQDEFIYVVSGEVVLQTEAGEELLRTGMCAGLPAGMRDGYSFLNRSEDDALLLVVGDRTLGQAFGDRRGQSRRGPDTPHRVTAGDDTIRA
jgi:uncharacterized cupin superfamily protein